MYLSSSLHSFNCVFLLLPLLLFTFLASWPLSFCPPPSFCHVKCFVTSLCSHSLCLLPVSLLFSPIFVLSSISLYHLYPFSVSILSPISFSLFFRFFSFFYLLLVFITPTTFLVLPSFVCVPFSAIFPLTTGLMTQACSPIKGPSQSGLWCWETSNGQDQRLHTGWDPSVVMETVSPYWFLHVNQVYMLLLVFPLVLWPSGIFSYCLHC